MLNKDIPFKLFTESAVNFYCIELIINNIGKSNKSLRSISYDKCPGLSRVCVSRVSSCPGYIPVQGFYLSRVYTCPWLFLSRVYTFPGFVLPRVSAYPEFLPVQGLYLSRVYTFPGFVLSRVFTRPGFILVQGSYLPRVYAFPGFVLVHGLSCPEFDLSSVWSV